MTGELRLIRFQSDTPGHPVETSQIPRASKHSQGDFEMKQLLIVLSLLAASAAPAMAEGFPNPYQTQM